MHFESRLSQSSYPEEIIGALSEGPSGEFDAGVLFLSMMSREDVKAVVEGIRRNISMRNFLVATCSGVIGNDTEIEEQPGAALMLAKLPGVKLTPFYLDQAELKQLETPAAWHGFFDLFPNEQPVFLLLPDPFLLDINTCIKGINGAYPGCSVAGGLASGANQPQGNTLVLNDDFYDQGLVGLALTGDIAADTVVSQGCRPIGEIFVVTKAEQNILYEIGGRPFLDVLQELVSKADRHDQILLRQAILIGIAIDEGKTAYHRGDFLIRGLMRLDQETGAGMIGDHIHPGQSIQFHVRDAGAAIEDLNELLAFQQGKKDMQKPEGALVFSCTGRGEGLFSCKNHDIETIQEHLGPIPAAGFFCAGEIGRIGSKSFLHGFTNSMLLFYRKSAQERL